MRFRKGRFKRMRRSVISNNSLCNHIYKADIKINLPMNYIEQTIKVPKTLSHHQKILFNLQVTQIMH